MPKAPFVSPLVSGLSDSVFGQLAQEARELGRTFFPLHVGDTHLEPLACARAEAQTTEQHPLLHTYAPVQGMPQLLGAILRKVKRRHGVDLSVANIQVMSGATAGLGVVCTALLEPGDEVLLPSPFWPLIRGIIRSRGAVPVEVPMFHRLDDSTFDPMAALEAAVTSKTVALYLNTPHNPTGQVIDSKPLTQLGEFAAKHNLWILSDEVYEDLAFNLKPEPLFANPGFSDRVVASHSVSKAYGLAGSRVGYTHGPRAAMEAIRGVQTFYTYCAPKPLQLGAARVLNEGDAWLADANALYARAAKLAAEALEVPTPAAGTFLFFNAQPYLRNKETIMDFLRRCLAEGVMLTPGAACGQDFDSWARLCFSVIDEDSLAQALAQLQSVLRG